MQFIEATILGIVQGLTEYFPVSSTMHLIIIQKILKLELQSNKVLIFNTFIQLGTLFAVINFFFIDIFMIIKSIFKITKNLSFCSICASNKMAYLILAATIPTVLAGYVFKSYLEFYFFKQYDGIYFLYITSLILLISAHFSDEKNNIINLNNALVIGLAQAFALIPGISRSGVTIFMALLLGLNKSNAIKFSFLISIPVILAANFFTLVNFYLNFSFTFNDIVNMIISFLITAILGNIVISFSIRFLKYCRLEWFGIYCAVIASIFLYFK